MITQLTNSINLPYDIVNIILSYDNRFVIRNGKIRTRIDVNKLIYRKIQDVYSVLSFAYYSRYDESEEDVIIELPINENKLYLINGCVSLDDETNTKSVERCLFIKYLDERVDTVKLLIIY